MLKDYNGWKNRDTWSVSLWIANDYGLYTSALEFMKDYKGRKPYKDFIEYMLLEDEKNPDNIKWISNKLGYRELNNFMNEFKEH